MGRECKGICVRHEYKRTKGKRWFEEGVKRCSECEIFIIWATIWCPCCHGKLSGRPERTSADVKRVSDE